MKQKKLPDGVSASTFARAVEELRAVVGSEWIFTTDDDVGLYRDAYSLRWNAEDEFLASAAVAPASVEEVQAVVRIANKYKLPVYPISTGRNMAYGGSAPSYSGSLIVDLKRMNRVLKVDEKRAFALVEPGCSYFDLYNYIQERGLKVWIDCPDPGWGSPIGNALDRGLGYTATPFRDHFAAHRGMEVVLPNGEIMRTGMGALPSADTWQEYRYGVGPDVSGLFAQGNFGIVTKMGFRLFPQPEAWLEGSISVPLYSDLKALIENWVYLEDSGLATGRTEFSSPLRAALTDDEYERFMADGWPSVEQLDRLAREKGVHAWEVQFNFYGPQKTVLANWEYAQERILRDVPGAIASKMQTSKLPLTPEQEKTHHLVNFGIPNMEQFARIARNRNSPVNPPDGHVDIVNILPRTFEAVYEFNKLVYETQKRLGIQAWMHPFRAPITWSHGCLLSGSHWAFNRRDDVDSNRRSEEEFAEMIRVTCEAGFGVYRTAQGTQSLLANLFSFNDNAMLRFVETLKDAADPNGIIAPGRYGVWPKKMRGKNR
jgi:FAD/FMN-containing dehydrogenase